MAKRDYSNWSKEELIREVKKIAKEKKYGILWEDNPEDVAKRCEKELPVLTESKDKEIVTDKDKPVNILIEGDNYHALSVLNYTHKGKIDVIYIDPPYNTGNKDFVYNDSYVDKEDAYRHSKWLSFMEKRLNLAKNLLSKQGVIFISIDENEFAQLKLLCDGIFLEENFCGIFVWQKKYGGGNDAGQIATEHEYVLCYSKNRLSNEWLEAHDEDYLKRYKEKDEWGRFFWDTLERPGLKNPIEVKLTFEGKTYTLKTFRSQKTVEEDLKNGEIRIVKIGNKISFQFKQRLKEGKKPRSILQDKNGYGEMDGLLKIGSNATAKQELREIFGKDIFNNPKPNTLIKYLIKITGLKKGIVLDFFAGSGTTAHAVLELNKKDEGKRTFILCTDNQDNNGTGLKIATDICYPRIKKVIQTLVKESNGKLVKNMPGNLKYFKTDFVDAEPTDRNKHKMVDKSTEMLCLKEECFDEVMQGKSFRLFTNSQNKNLGIIYDDDGIVPFKKEIKKLKKKFFVYVFSLDESAREEEFEDVAEWVELKPIPAVILNVYKRIFR